MHSLILNVERLDQVDKELISVDVLVLGVLVVMLRIYISSIELLSCVLHG